MDQRPRVLVVEDDGLVAIVVKTLLDEIGCEVVGPLVDRAAAVTAAVSGSLEAAVVDHIRDGELDYAVEDALARNSIPFGLVIGPTSRIAARYRDRPTIVKPFTMEGLYAFVAAVFEAPNAST